MHDIPCDIDAIDDKLYSHTELQISGIYGSYSEVARIVVISPHYPHYALVCVTNIHQFISL